MNEYDPNANLERIAENTYMPCQGHPKNVSTVHVTELSIFEMLLDTYINEPTPDNFEDCLEYVTIGYEEI